MIKILPLKYVPQNMLYIGQPVVQINSIGRNLFSRDAILLGRITHITLIDSQLSIFLNMGPMIAVCFRQLIDKKLIVDCYTEEQWGLLGMSLTSCFVGKCKTYNKLYEKYKQTLKYSVLYTQSIISNTSNFSIEGIK